MEVLGYELNKIEKEEIMGINSDVNKYYNIVNNIFQEEYISRGMRPSKIKKYFTPENLDEFIKEKKLKDIDVIKKVIDDVIDDMVSIEKDENRSKKLLRKKTLNEEVVLTFESFKVFESDNFELTSIIQCLYKGIDKISETETKTKKFLADHYDTNLSQIVIVDEDKHMFKVANWESDNILVIVYNKDEMDIIKDNIVEYLTNELLKEKVDVIGITIPLKDIMDKSKSESYIQDLLSPMRITDLINQSLKDTFDVYINDDFYIWVKKE